MKNIYRVTRPTWAAMDRSETGVILLASLVLGIYGAWGDLLPTILFNWLQIAPTSIQRFKPVAPIIDVVVVTFGCLLLIHWYKRLRVGCYPSTFIYCFDMPEASNPSGKSQVVGYCHLKPNMDDGEIAAYGASFFWENGRLDVDSLVGFTSTLVRGTKEKDETTCHIRYDINTGDSAKRFYRHGLLQFQLATNVVTDTGNDAYAGYLRSTRRRDGELQDVEVRAKGYAEWYSNGCVEGNEIQTELARSGDMLIAKLSGLLNATPQSTLWRAKDHMSSHKTNIWGHQIPTPQSVILDEELYPYIDRLLSKVLALNGLKAGAIETFKKLARRKAKLEEDDLLVAYEHDLKAGLINLIKRDNQDEALNDRARIIYEEIKPFLSGDSLLDIGCGNGLICNLAKDQFKRIQLLDVVKYVPNAFNLPFKLYTEGHPLPIKESFDTVLLLTVLHHSSDPVELLKMAWGATEKKLIIIESVVGVHQVTPGTHYELATLSDKHQIAYAAFVDWFYNRVLHDNIPVPYNFTMPDKWQSIFLQHNMHLTQAIHLGQDIEIGPEYHILFVLEK